MKKEILVNRIAWFLLVLLVLVAAKGLLVYPRDPATLSVYSLAGHEWKYNLWRLLAMADALADGMPGRWLQGFSHGWGYPLFHYTGPLPYTFGGLLVLIGFEPHSALNVCWITAYFLTGVSMFWATKPILGRWGALLAACCYLLAPYHLVDTYVRTNLPETTAFIFPPLILRALLSDRVSSLKPVVLGTLAIMLIPLTHILSTYLVGLGLVIFCVVYLILLPSNNVRFIFLKSGITMAGIGLGLSAFFWLPAIIDISAVRGFQAMTKGFYGYSQHFVYIDQLFNHYWEYGASEPGHADFMSFSLGPSIVAFAVLATAISLYRLIKYNRQPTQTGYEEKDGIEYVDLCRIVIACIVSTLVMAFLALGWSKGLWAVIPKIEVVQFPWRFLLPSTLFLAISAGALPRLLAGFNFKFPWLEFTAAALMCLTVIFLHWNFARVGQYAAADREELLLENQMKFGVWTTNEHEFLPSAVREIPYRGLKRLEVAKFYDKNFAEQKRIMNEKIENGIARLTLIPGEAGVVVLNQHWHPAWHASVDGEPVKTYAYPGHPFAPVAINVPAGIHSVEFRYGFTAAGIFAIILSLIILLSSTGYLLHRKQYSVLRLMGVPIIFVSAVWFFYWTTSIPKTVPLAQSIKQIDRHVQADKLATRKQIGTAWDQDGNVIFSESGLLVTFEQKIHQNAIELGLDSNDWYLIVFLSHGNVTGAGDVPKRKSGGISSYSITVPAYVLQKGYDSIAVFPVEGDGYYSLAHVITK
ncbi:MAG: hypothetical protein JXA04_03035 [Gammaproteobacteria bacterium]|nr:hypothetical protein [Gammaproteobacteria bacterium]